MINFADLTKEQKQYVFLGIVAVAGIGYGIVFGLQKSSASLSVAKAELKDLSSKVEIAERAGGQAGGSFAEATLPPPRVQSATSVRT